MDNSRRAFYSRIVAGVLIGIGGIVAFPEPTLLLLTIAAPISVIGAGVATAYLVRVFRAQPAPRSRFFRMLVETFAGLIVVGAWVAYLAIARTAERLASQGVDVWVPPAPPPAVSAPVSALLVVAVFLVPVRFAVTVWSLRRRSSDDIEKE